MPPSASDQPIANAHRSGLEGGDRSYASAQAADPAPPLSVPVASTMRRRPLGGAPLYFALFVVAVLGGSALFISGFTLGSQGALGARSDETRTLFQPFFDAYDKIDQDYVGETDDKRLVEGAIDGMFSALGDPYSSYMTSEEYRNSLSAISGQFEGIGAEMTSRNDAGETGCSPAGLNCHLIVVRTLRDSPAEKAGLRAEDEVLAVDGQSVHGMTLDETVTRVRGKKGTEVTLTVRRAPSQTLELRIVRDVIQSEDVTSEVLEGDIGYIRIQGFSSSAADDFREQLRELIEEDEVKGLVLDLRDDPGGFVDAARTIASQFVSDGPIFWEEYADGRQVEVQADPDGIATDPSLPLVVLVNGATASASEIVAAALQESGRAQLVGDTTFGKGTIQTWQELPDYGGFRLSIAKWLTPDKNWLHEQGVEPDVKVTVVGTPEEDHVLNRALELLADETSASTDGSLRRAA